MPNSGDILISVRSKFVDSILSGAKRVELRRRAPKVGEQTRVWIYDKAPAASVRALAILGGVETLPPAQMWDKHNETIGLSAEEFAGYVNGLGTVSALLLEHIHPLRRPVPLAALRALAGGFHPPQFYLKLGWSSDVLKRLTQEISCQCDACSAWRS